jgi:multiple sugar transport system substrate-binding protein
VRRVLALLAACGACGRAGASDRGDQIRLEVATGADYVEARLEHRVLERYLAANPGTRIIQRSVAGIPAVVPLAGPPDAFLLDQRDIPALVNRAAVLDLAPYLTRAAADLDCFNPTVLRAFTRGDTVLALPTGYTPIVVIYNKDLFDRAGLPYPTDAWTWADFERIGRRLTRDTDGDGRTDLWGAYFDRRAFLWLPWIWSGGGDVLCREGRRASGCLDAPTTIAALRWYAGWVTNHAIAPRPAGLGKSPDDDRRLFYTGQVAMVTAGHAWVPQLRAYVGQGRLRVGVVAIPRRPGFRPATAIYASGYAVPAAAPRRRLSVELTTYLTDSLAQALRGEAGFELPAFTPVAEALAARDTLGWEAAFLRAARHGRVPWSARIERWAEVESALTDALDRIVLAGDDPDTAAHDAARQLDGLLGTMP